VSSFFTGIPVNFTCNHSGNLSGIGKSMKCNTAGDFGGSKSNVNLPRFRPTGAGVDSNKITKPLFFQIRSDGHTAVFGYLGRNTLNGPGRNDWDVALLKNFKLPLETSVLQFRLETYNIFNHTQYQTISAGCGSTAAYGAACSGAQNVGNGAVTSAWSPR